MVRLKSRERRERVSCLGLCVSIGLFCLFIRGCREKGGVLHCQRILPVDSPAVGVEEFGEFCILRCERGEVDVFVVVWSLGWVWCG